MNLFQFGDFTLSSGMQSRFRIECDAISPDEWHSLARIALPLLPPYSQVLGVPRGGTAWAQILENYVQPGAHKLLIVDDVWTTGNSIRRAWAGCGYGHWHGLVLFARGPVPKDVTALFMLNEHLQ